MTDKTPTPVDMDEIRAETNRLIREAKRYERLRTKSPLRETPDPDLERRMIDVRTNLFALIERAVLPEGYAVYDTRTHRVEPIPAPRAPRVPSDEEIDAWYGGPGWRDLLPKAGEE